MADLTKLVLHSNFPGFHQRNFYSGTLVISGTITTAGIVQVPLGSITLDETPDILEVMFNGPSASSRPDDAWFKPRMGSVIQYGNGGIDTLVWVILITTSGRVVNFVAVTEKLYYGNFVPTSSVSVLYRMVDYSALT